MPRANFTLPTDETQLDKNLDKTRRPRLTAAERRQTHSNRGRRLVAGCMCGTSLDGLDVALLDVQGEGLAMHVELVSETSRPLGELAKGLRALADQQPMDARTIAALARDLALIHLDALIELKHGKVIDLVAIHGQTVLHAPPLSWQLINPAPLAHGLGVPVVSDLRAADVACGGEGAPLTPIADLILFSHGNERRCVVNLGGFCNLSRLPTNRDAKRVQGADVCACNQVLDAVARAKLGAAYDRDGRAAMQGSPDDEAVQDLVRLLRAQSKAGRSLGTGDELNGWMDAHRTVPPADLARSACAAIATVIAEAARPADRLIIAGGGVRNRALVQEIKGRAEAQVDMSDGHGVPATLREAMCWAVLGALCQDRVSISLPQVTGVENPPIAGCWTMP